MSSHDVIVIGLGGMGGAAVHRLAAEGLRVLGLDRFPAVHDQGSSHGGSRIIRQAYFEGADYVPLLLRAYELWDELEAESGLEIRHRTGGLMVGPADSLAVAGSLRSAEAHGLDHELLDAAEIRRRFPTMTPADSDVALYEAAAGFVSPEQSVTANLTMARRHGAELRHGVRVDSWTADSAGVTVHADDGVHRAERLVICPGAWAPDLLARLGLPLVVERMVQFWFRPTAGPASFAEQRHPIFIWEDAGRRQAYAFPMHAESDGTVKAAFFRSGDNACTPDTIDRRVAEGEEEELRRFLSTRVPTLPGPLARAKTCMYTTTPDEHFVIGPHPRHDRVTLACGFSGHGFKFVPVVGEIVADLVARGTTRHPIAMFDPLRFGPQG
ncbi:sarcosine oxidase [Actinoalloteichus hoggarensis]|uniref:Monomeric sarcosine oxidase n=1 Tax=Actinoalloteichus hoggarensis TaxID=1470176 RepID=A0A221W1X2_9PSEU|nr:N-methyl-L-tryptophan oxidase [Actinoalloteichus hoggarensis]ASO19776.1 Monomeric sarcosine oxidase [Actinoalloteichus hoggarensis]MBB5919517.1 sarcosine oxidase [Actinoalloteichus hoggarensis]